MLVPEAGLVFKVILVGDAAVGKTSIVNKHLTSAIKEKYFPSLGANVATKDYDIAGSHVTLKIWDIAAQEKFSWVRQKYYMMAKAGIIVYDVTKPGTFENVRFWFADLKTYLPDKIPMILIANKIDLPAIVDMKAGQRLADEIGAEFIETSAMTGENIQKAFERITETLLASAPSSPQKKK
nr:Rab family GTPase [Candidatus Njordarchaeum guaymaensis]